MTITAQLKSLHRLGWSLDGLAPEDWPAALVDCLPAPLRAWLRRRDRWLLVQVAGPMAELYAAAGDDRQHLGALELSGSALTPVLPGGHDAGRERTLLVIPADQVLRRTVTFPIQVRENLAQVMRYELDRLSPFSADQVCFDFNVRAGGRADRVTVELALCRRDRVDPWLARLRELGRPVSKVTWDGAWPRSNLLAAADRPPRVARLITAERIALLVAAVLLVAILASPLWQREQILEQREAELRRLRAEAVQVDEVRRALELAREGSVAVLRQKAEQPRMIDLLRELTETLPDDTWIQSLDVQGSEVQLRGESARATALIELLERAPGIDGVAFRSPVTQVAQTGMERFNIAFQYVRPSTP